MRTLAALDSPIRSFVVSPDGSTVLTASGSDIGFHDLASGERRVISLADGVHRLAWGPDGPLAGTASGEVWTVGRRVQLLVEAIDDQISGIAVAGDGTIAVCGGDPFAVATFGRYGNEEWRGEPSKWPYCVRFSADGTQLAMATWDGRLVVLDTSDLPDELGDADAEYAGGPIFDAQFLPDDNLLVAGARFVRVWDSASGTYTRTCELAAEAFAIAVAPDGTFAVVSTNDQRLRVFGLPDLEELGQLAMGRDAVELRGQFPDYAAFCQVRGPATIHTLAFHPDGTRLFASTDDGRLLEVTRAELDGVARPARRPAQAAAASELTTRAPSNGARANEPAADEQIAGEPGDDAPGGSPWADEQSAGEATSDGPSGSPWADDPYASQPTSDGSSASPWADEHSARAPTREGSSARAQADDVPAIELSGSKPSPSTPPRNKRSASRQTADKPSANGSSRSKPSSNKASAKRSSVNKTAAGKQSTNKPSASKLASVRPSSNKLPASKASSSKSSGKPSAGRSSAKKLSASRPSASRPSADPSAKRQSAKQPPVPKLSGARPARKLAVAKSALRTAASRRAIKKQPGRAQPRR